MQRNFSVCQDRNIIPPFMAFCNSEDSKTELQAKEVIYFDYESQKTIIPLFCGSDKKCTRSAKNVGSFLFPKWKNETDDAVEK